MGELYREATGEEGIPTTDPLLREVFQQPGAIDKDTGLPAYFTEQSHKDATDINKIIAKFDKTGLITHVSKFEAHFGDLQAIDFKEAQDLVNNSMKMFNELPSKIRDRFENSPENLLAFMADPLNRDEAIELGIISSTWTEATDGLGEHVPEGGNIEKVPPPHVPVP